MLTVVPVTQKAGVVENWLSERRMTASNEKDEIEYLSQLQKPGDYS
jgi:hypothetical protein